MPFVPAEPDEGEITRAVLGMCDYESDATMLRGIRRVLPGHLVTWRDGRVVVDQYWDPTQVPAVRFPDPRDYVDAFRVIAAEAVASRLPADGPVGCHLSGGLDSGTVAVLAGRALAAQRRELVAVTAVPADPDSARRCVVPGGLFDEWPLAAATASCVPGVRHLGVSAADRSPIEEVRSWLAAGGDPVRNPSALRWMAALASAVRDHGCTTMLTGLVGNAAFSWGPNLDPVPLRRRVRRTLIPAQVNASIDIVRHPDWFRESALLPHLARGASGREAVSAYYRNDRSRDGQTRLVRRSIHDPVADMMSRIHQVENLDPTADLRVLSYCLGVPAHVFHDRNTGENRRLIRQATAGLLPEQVRRNEQVGRQGADTASRLRADAAGCAAALEELARGRAAEYVDVYYLKTFWATIQRKDSPEFGYLTDAVLLRGIIHGLWINAI
jgi:asparagine synthase (glutamine-hydrolysing)